MSEKTVKVVSLEKDKSFPILREHTEVLHLGHVYLEPGSDCSLHSTSDFEEILIILDGEGVIEAGGGQVSRIEKNNVVYVPPHTPHNVIAKGNSLRYIYIVAPCHEKG